MSQSWHPDDSDWREGSKDDNSAAVPCIILERPFIVPVILRNDVVPQQPHVVLCSAYDEDDEDCEE